MTYLNIPIFFLDAINIEIKYTNKLINNNNIYLSNTLNTMLYDLKTDINNYSQYWDLFKKITNPYEYIHTQIKNKSLSVCDFKPISRSFFKLIEIANVFNIFSEKTDITTLHLAEGPGGFIQALDYIRNNINNNNNDNYYGITLMSNDINIPNWKKPLYDNKKIKIIFGKTNNGDLLNIENLIYFQNNYKNKFNYITADGGIDFSIDFNSQELLSNKLIISEIFYTIITQKVGGTFILKIFDIFKYKTAEYIYLLSNLYQSVHIYKPNTSRIANSEKYIICKGYKGDIFNLSSKIIKNFKEIIDNDSNIYSIFDFKINKYFYNKIDEINLIYGQQQMENINNTLNLIRELKNLIYFSNYHDKHNKNNKNNKIFNKNNLFNINNKTNLLKTNNKTNLLNTSNKETIIQSINKTIIENKHIKKETIPKRIRELVWTTHNTEVFSNKCYVSWCDNIINVFNFQVGHDIPESKGGTLDIDNLKPICGNCNLSMSNNYSIKEWSNLIKINKNISNNNTPINDNIIIRPETVVNKDTVITPETVITPDIKEYPETNETNELQRNNSFLNTICNRLPTIPLQLPLITMILYPLKYIRV